ncbi:MAG: 2-(1,2-epoxy-1,2-dihydrophenyl)acetyl-CoA isomerase [Rhodocyclales bacterium CG17_big_fil_post_rev_8_21_14_2_50_68_7]|nr:MAG: 2-(1,2-epoxy-1,2-dihydrophenyl)acetyl-CoA isomerase [Betaproteobacteria bacterium CG2_30_68_42]PIV71758.1 MAG: 2-(1,2-epoxy-1,2-dihydrophenyl)acetyl-CoA isomerase [Rhodocyclales bacterium CG17_big_fil_post_rev_8_21_14_2_50_68_7]PIX74125.1 MAG: 2-(1,2-epoxy-1,2-dihydrophenyl)acetyl-CoA isomerase [Rhodocyclales bacterium CG_4_10_14_3_um_filter_68_10]PJA57122.1 MAG: 2-(1,2-epoxy-1,2-dihydrophenyl)acetyl-CoA isomerase [Rhodocyclales bacterium CG_4_9_14_3_um_filter_68_10]
MKPEYENIRYALAGGIARITLDRPEKRNALSVPMHRELRDALERSRAGPTRVLLLEGAGGAFCSGQDLDERVFDGDRAPDLGASIETWYKPLILALRALEMPVVCAVGGVAAGAGASLALACDIVLAARSAVFIQSFSRIGLAPDCGASFLLPRLAGSARAMGLAMLGEPLSAEQAERWGIIWRCVEDDALGAEAEKLVQALAAGPTRALAAIRRVLHASWENGLEAQLDLERDVQRALGASRDYREGVTAFREKRKPRFEGR